MWISPSSADLSAPGTPLAGSQPIGLFAWSQLSWSCVGSSLPADTCPEGPQVARCLEANRTISFVGPTLSG